MNVVVDLVFGTFVQFLVRSAAVSGRHVEVALERSGVRQGESAYAELHRNLGDLSAVRCEPERTGILAGNGILRHSHRHEKNEVFAGLDIAL